MFGLRKLLAGEIKITDPEAFHLSTLTRWQSQPHQAFDSMPRWVKSLLPTGSSYSNLGPESGALFK